MTEYLDLQRTVLQPPEDITRDLFGRGRSLGRRHPLATDAVLAAVLLALSTVWLAGSPFADFGNALIQTALVGAIALRRRWPSAVFVAVSAIAFGQWLLGVPLIGDGALLIALYTVAAHQSRNRALLAAALVEVGAVMAAVKWEPAGPAPRSLLFLTATVVAALTAGLTAASGSRYLTWMDERARRLAVERDQQATIATAAERTRIARELHDIVSHSLSVVITLADAAVVVSPAAPGRDAMAEVAEAGRQALSDMRAMLGVLRPETDTDGHAAGGTAGRTEPQPGLSQLDGLVERIRATGLTVHLGVEGHPFPLGAAAELSAYRIVQEALTNTLRHAEATRARVRIRYDAPQLTIRIADDGTANINDPNTSHLNTSHLNTSHLNTSGHGIAGMRERAALHGGTVSAGPVADGGWLVEATLRSA
ncbi:MAG TPA: sensor histidine kinase [Streptosporangiaceae bacterium]